ncbi:MAG: DUF4405 domain-containing protein [Bacteroidales bacterium]|nr:DUF4405 domain-containing protein [Bacteroidales bacterium]
MNKKFNWQIFISIALLLSFLLVLFSGIVLYIAPEGSLSRWISWDILGLTKKQWEYQHTVFTFIFAILCILHAFKINWSLFLSYFITNKKTITNHREIIVSIILVIGIFIGTIFQVNPLKQIIRYGNSISDSHAKNVVRPDFPDPEKLSLEQFSETILKTSFSEMRKNLIKCHFKSINQDISIENFCKKNNLSPEQFYKLLITK